jgi:mono/diheme cytochrome c family protein
MSGERFSLGRRRLRWYKRPMVKRTFTVRLTGLFLGLALVGALFTAFAGARPLGATKATATGKSLFKANCAKCHTLKAAKANGTVGPNLDQKRDSVAKIVKQVTSGGRFMPPFGQSVGGSLTAAQIKLIATFVHASR